MLNIGCFASSVHISSQIFVVDVFLGHSDDIAITIQCFLPYSSSLTLSGFLSLSLGFWEWCAVPYLKRHLRAPHHLIQLSYQQFWTADELITRSDIELSPSIHPMHLNATQQPFYACQPFKLDFKKKNILKIIFGTYRMSSVMMTKWNARNHENTPNRPGTIGLEMKRNVNKTKRIDEEKLCFGFSRLIIFW